MTYEQRQRAARKGQQDDTLWVDWTLHAPRAAMTLYALLQSAGWQHLAEGGGWLNQDELLMEDLATLSEKHALVRLHMDANEADNADQYS